MDVILSSQKKCTLKELIHSLSIYEKKYLLHCISHDCFDRYNNNYQDSVNFIQLAPKIINSILLYSNGKKTTITPSDFECLKNKIISFEVRNMPYQERFNDYQWSYFAPMSTIIFKNTECQMNVIGRIILIFNIVEKENSNLGFEKVTGFDLSKLVFFLFSFGVMSEGGRVKENFRIIIRSMELSPQKIKELIRILEDHFLINLEDAVNEIKKHCKKNNIWTEDRYTPFEIKPLIGIEGDFLAISPHYILNSMADLLFKFYINSYSNNPNSNATDILGKAFEKYIIGLLGNQLKGYIIEPIYSQNQGNKGVDVIRVKKGKIPFFLELSKSVTYQSVERHFSKETYTLFLRERIIPKFEQIFHWIKDVEFSYNGVNLIPEINRTQFVVCIMKRPHCFYMDGIFKHFMEMLQKSWEEITEKDIKLKDKNIYLLSCFEIELLLSISKKTKYPLENILFDFKKKLKNTPVFFKEEDSWQIRDSLIQWAYKKYANHFPDPENMVHPELVKTFNRFFSKWQTNLKERN